VSFANPETGEQRMAGKLPPFHQTERAIGASGFPAGFGG
jgi:hypothetical protein